MAKRETTVPSSKQGLIFCAHALQELRLDKIESITAEIALPSNAPRSEGQVAVHVPEQVPEMEILSGTAGGIRDFFEAETKGTLLGRPFCQQGFEKWQIETFRWQWGKVRRDWDDWACLGSTQLPPFSCRGSLSSSFFHPSNGDLGSLCCFPKLCLRYKVGPLWHPQRLVKLLYFE